MGQATPAANGPASQIKPSRIAIRRSATASRMKGPPSSIFSRYNTPSDMIFTYSSGA